MNARTKIILSLIGTLIAGILIGSLGTSALHNQRAERLRKMRDRGGVTRYLARVLETDQDSLNAELRATIEEAEERFREIQRLYRDSLDTARTSMMDDLRKQLTPAQIERLEAKRKRGRRNGHSGHRRNQRK